LNDPSTVKKVFLVHGEESVMDEFSVKLKAVGFSHVHQLERGVSIALK